MPKKTGFAFVMASSSTTQKKGGGALPGESSSPLFWERDVLTYLAATASSTSVVGV